MDPASFSRFSNVLSFNAGIVSNDGVSGVSNFSTRLNGIKSPVISSVSTGNLLVNRGKETLRVEESSQPEGDRSVLGQPVSKTEVSVLERSEPSRESRAQPGDFSTRGIEEPHCGYTEIENELDASGNFRGHNNLSINSKAHISHPSADNSKNVLETLNFLEQEHNKRNRLSSFGKTSMLHGFKSIFDIEHLEIFGQELNEFVLNHFLDELFGRFTTSSTGISGLSINKSSNHSSGSI